MKTYKKINFESSKPESQFLVTSVDQNCFNGLCFIYTI